MFCTVGAYAENFGRCRIRCLAPLHRPKPKQKDARKDGNAGHHEVISALLH